VTGDVELRGHLRAADVVGEPADRVVDDLHHGSAVVLVEVAEIDPSAARARLDGLA
jgi:hypothetical protein